MSPSVASTSPSPPPVEYRIGGSLQANEPTYVERQADRELYETVKAGKFCYLFNARQIGKSSVRVRVMQRLQEEGVACGGIDLSSIGSSQEVTPKKWYASVIRHLIREFNLGDKVNIFSWLRERSDFTSVELLDNFFETVLLAEVTQPIAIFFDEIDSILSLKDFSRDDFFAFIRYCYNVRANKPDFRRLTFIFIGVANPSDLMQDKVRTPFNIGRAIDLTGFTLEEVREPLGVGLKGKVANPEAVLREILVWTRGQPFLTQKLCKLVQDSPSLIAVGEESESVTQLVREHIIQRWEAQDVPEHLKTIRDRLLRDDRNPRKARVLALYQQVLRHGEVNAVESPEEVDLRLSGLVVKLHNKICCRNLIYKVIFDSKWVQQELANIRPYADRFNEWYESGPQDKSLLLRGAELQQAKEWAIGKSLGDEDHQFLNLSQEQERIEVEAAYLKASKAEYQANRRLEKASRKLEQAKRKAKRWIQIASAALITSFAIVAISIVFGLWLERTNRVKLRTLQLSQEALEALREFETSSQLKALLTIVGSAQKIEAWSLFERSSVVGNALGKILAGIEERNQFISLDSEIWSISLSPDGQYLVAGLEDGTARLWDLNGNLLNVFLGHRNKVQSVSFSPDSNYFATGSWDGTVMVWDLQGNIVRQEITERQARVWSVSFSPDGKHLAIGSEDGIVRVRNLNDDALYHFAGHQERVLSVSFSQDSQQLVTSSADDTARIWDLQGNLLMEFKGHQNDIYSARFSPDGQQIATSSGDGTARLWNLQGEPIKEFRGHAGPVYSVRFRPGEQQLVTSSEDGTALLWNFEGDRLDEFRGHRGRVWSIEFTPNGRQLATGSADGIARLWNLTNPELVKLEGHQGLINSASFSPDGDYLATGSADGTARIWDLEGNQLAVLRGHGGPIVKVIFRPNGKHLVTGSADGTARMWDMMGKHLVSFEGHSDWVWGVDFSSNGQQLVTSSSDGTVRLYDLSTIPQNRVIGASALIDLGDKNEVWTVKFSPEGQQLATGSADGTARLWDLDGNILEAFSGHEGSIWSLSFSPDGGYLLTGSADKTARLWDLKDKRLQEIFTGHEGTLNSVNFMLDDRQLIAVSGSADGTVRLWNLQGNVLQEFIDPDRAAIHSTSISPNGEQILTAASKGKAYLWQFSDYENLIDRGCEWLDDYLDIHPRDRRSLTICDEE